MAEFLIRATVWVYREFETMEEAQAWADDHTVFELLETGEASDMTVHWHSPGETSAP